MLDPASYPRPCRRWNQAKPADKAICQKCGCTMRLDPAEGDPYDRCLTHKGCGGQIVFMWYEVGACKNCDALGGVKVNGCCSYRCEAQWLYAERLRESRAPVRRSRPLSGAAGSSQGVGQVSISGPENGRDGSG